MTLSPDGKWLWNGEDWIPAPPKASPSAMEDAKEAIREIAQKHGLEVEDLAKVVENFDLDQDGSIDKEEIEKAVQATEVKPDEFPPKIESGEADFSIESTQSSDEIRPNYVLESEHKNDYRDYASPSIPSPNWASSSQKDELYATHWEGSEVDADVSINGLQAKKIPIIVGSVIVVLTLIIVALSPMLANLDNASISDLDGDGIPNSEESDFNGSLFNPDTDGDGLFDGVDSCVSSRNSWVSEPALDHDSDGCQDSGEDLDDDNDGIPDDQDSCPKGKIGWISNSTNDFDGDGCRDSDEDNDDDNDSWIDVSDIYPYQASQWADTDGDGYGDNPNGYQGDAFPNDATQWSDSDGDGYGDNPDGNNADAFPSTPSQWADRDGDGYGDNISGFEADIFPDEASQWFDRDGDGWGDNPNGFQGDVFPDDSSEWLDTDQDGWGDNSDPDDDNDGVLDFEDVNPGRDVAIYLDLDEFEVVDAMDYFDSYTELYICVYVEGISQGCVPDTTYWSLEEDVNYYLNRTFFIDLDDRLRYHVVEIAAYDYDSWDDDMIDINPQSGYDYLRFNLDSTLAVDNTTYVADGTQDNTGYDGILKYTIRPLDSSKLETKRFEWDYDGRDYSLTWELDYSIYVQMRGLDHTIDYSSCSTQYSESCIEQYAAFGDPDENLYLLELAEHLEQMSIQAGHTSELEIAEFVYAFVGDIQYQFDIDQTGQSEYPKYPIEMLWDQGGDCEDAALLYIAMIELLGYDAYLAVGGVKDNQDEDWGGHAWALVHIPNHSGAGYYGTGDKSQIPYYFVEATAHYDGVSEIGRNPWYDTDLYSIFDIESNW